MLAFHHRSDDGLRLRGLEVSRVDAVSDVIFGFAVTLLVVSLQVPKDFAELHALMAGFLPFGVCFLLLMLVWHTHYKFFRRFGLNDVPTLWLNGLLLFFVLFYTYPLKFLFVAFFNQRGINGTPHDILDLTLLYAGGFTAIYAIVALMYANAWRLRDALELTPLERRLTRLYFWDEAWLGIIGIATCAVALILPARASANATMMFMFIGLSKTLVGRKIGRAHKAFPAPVVAHG